MEQLSIWNDITTIKQRYLNLLHGMTRVDQHPRRFHSGKNINIYNIQKIGFKIQFQNILQDYGIKCVTLSKIQYKTLEIDLSNYLIISSEQKRRNTALLQFV